MQHGVTTMVWWMPGSLHAKTQVEPAQIEIVLNFAGAAAWPPHAFLRSPTKLFGTSPLPAHALRGCLLGSFQWSHSCTMSDKVLQWKVRRQKGDKRAKKEKKTTREADPVGDCTGSAGGRRKE